MNYLIKKATIVNEGETFVGDVRITDGLIAEVGQNLEHRSETIIDATGKLLLP
jgi:dihydroorotase